MTPQLAEALDAAKLSNRDAAKIIAAVAQSFGVDIREYNINKTSIRDQREKLRASSATKMKNTIEIDKVLAVQWDGKTVQSLLGTASKETLAIGVKGVNTNLMLAAPEIESGSGENIAEAVHCVLEEWGLIEKIKAGSFDSTAANTGTVKQPICSQQGDLCCKITFLLFFQV